MKLKKKRRYLTRTIPPEAILDALLYRTTRARHEFPFAYICVQMSNALGNIRHARTARGSPLIGGTSSQDHLVFSLAKRSSGVGVRANFSGWLNVHDCTIWFPLSTQRNKPPSSKSDGSTLIGFTKKLINALNKLSVLYTLYKIDCEFRQRIPGGIQIREGLGTRHRWCPGFAAVSRRCCLCIAVRGSPSVAGWCSTRSPGPHLSAAGPCDGSSSFPPSLPAAISRRPDDYNSRWLNNVHTVKDCKWYSDKNNEDSNNRNNHTYYNFVESDWAAHLHTVGQFNEEFELNSSRTFLTINCDADL